MNKFNILGLFFVTFIILVTSNDTITQKQSKVAAKQAAHISPEIINELKDFRNLIPKATVDEIVAKYLLLDGNFRTALIYLRSQEFAQLQQKLLSVPEIVGILEFLHLTTEPNATTRHMGATKISTQPARVTEYNDNAAADSDNRVNTITTKTDTIISQPNTMRVGNLKDVLSNQELPKRPQQLFRIKEKNNKNILDNGDVANAISNAKLSNEQEPLVRIVLLEDLEVKAKIHNEGHHKHHHHHKYPRQCTNCYHSHHGPLGTFTSFVEEILQHLPNSAYQYMIKDNCKKNPQFAEFYKALRSPEFKPLIEKVKSTDNIKKIIGILSSHDVDVNSLQPIAFKVIFWGPNI